MKNTTTTNFHPKGIQELNMGIWNLKTQIAAQHPELANRFAELHEKFLKGKGLKSLSTYYESLLKIANEN